MAIGVHRLLALALLVCGGVANAEPWFALDTGQKCAACHVNPTGGGKRTAYGNAFAQMVLPARSMAEWGQFWDGRLNRYARVGGDLRFNATDNRVPNQPDNSQFDFEEVLVYLELRLLEDMVTFYVDERIAPGGAVNREAYALLRHPNGLHLKAGKMFLPYGWRLEDDTEFIRQVSGINYATPDDGLEFGWDGRRASVQLAITNGTAGAGEIDSGKQYSFRGEYIRNRWRAGASFNLNDADAGERQMQNLFAGVRTGPVNWLVEAGQISDESFPEGKRDLRVLFGEANIAVRQGHNLKLSYGWFDPDDAVDEDERQRYSLVWEYFPLPFTQFSLGARVSEGIPQNDVQNIDEFFLQLHAFF